MLNIRLLGYILVLTVGSMKIAVFWITAPRRLVEIYKFSNVLAASIANKLLPNYMARYHSRQRSSNYYVFFTHLVKLRIPMIPSVFVALKKTIPHVSKSVTILRRQKKFIVSN